MIIRCLQGLLYGYINTHARLPPIGWFVWCLSGFEFSKMFVFFLNTSEGQTKWDTMRVKNSKLRISLEYFVTSDKILGNLRSNRKNGFRWWDGGGIECFFWGAFGKTREIWNIKEIYILISLITYSEKGTEGNAQMEQVNDEKESQVISSNRRELKFLLLFCMEMTITISYLPTKIIITIISTIKDVLLHRRKY